MSGYRHTAKMRMRGQFHQSNPAVLSHNSNEGINIAEKVIREKTYDLFTVHGRKNAFFGSALNGIGVDDLQDPLPLHG